MGQAERISRRGSPGAAGGRGISRRGGRGIGGRTRDQGPGTRGQASRTMGQGAGNIVIGLGLRGGGVRGHN